MAFEVNTLPAYVQENRDILIKDFALVGNGTRARVGVQTGIKQDAQINYLDLEAVLQKAGCGWNAQGKVNLTQRVIHTAALEVMMSLCPDDLRGKYAEYLVRVAPQGDGAMPFEAYVMQALINNLNKKNEDLIWKGDTAKAGDANLKWIDGLLKLSASEEGIVKATIDGASAYGDISKAIAAIPDEALEIGAELYVAPAKYRQYLTELVEKNFYHYSGPVNEFPKEFVHPGSDVKVVYTPGLKGETSMLATFPDNIRVGCDIEGASEDIKVWWSEDNQEYRILAKWNIGVQVAFPELVLFASMA